MAIANLKSVSQWTRGLKLKDGANPNERKIDIFLVVYDQGADAGLTAYITPRCGQALHGIQHIAAPVNNPAIITMKVNFPPHAGLEFVKTARHDTYPAIDPAKANLAGQVVLVTGASRGIGKAIAIAFAQSGASGLVLLARSDLSATKAACEAAATRPGQSLKVLTVNVDASDTAQVDAAIAKVKETFGRLDIVINNAGACNPGSLIADSDPKLWWHTWDVNIRGTYEVTRAALPLLVESKGNKTIILVSSAAAHGIIETHNSAYGMSKLAQLRFAELLTNEYGDKGVVALAVHPGAIPTDMNADISDDFKAYLIDTPEIASHTIVWLAREPRAWLSGRYISCQWDMEELEAKRQEIVDGDKLKVRMAI
ncbi:uncharacterized protein FIBRA_06938 [Fibroporia radiculosa]|uniref:Ketoreductase domain-containing protein n=1 Tax=Fibroporia radiculosa TaxID=599839 RepID=J4GCY2_9APHY|nr:uncharacterized protein FIBRA_06938 [Fibroporia radiculosa]CCM04748.1 predicted protein [Fibroporia radiculosa]